MRLRKYRDAARVRRDAIVLGTLVCVPACGGALAGGRIGTTQPMLAPRGHAVQVTVRAKNRPATGVYCWLDGVTDHASGPSDGNGIIVFTYVPLSLRQTQLNCRGDGYQLFREPRMLTGADPEPALVAELVPRR